jgi:hypothetical protein
MIVAEPVGLGDVDVDVEDAFPITLRFRHICLTKVPNAVVLHENTSLKSLESLVWVTHFLNQNSCK